jgi:hypothetical protein
MLSERAQSRLLRNCWLVNTSELYRMGWQVEGRMVFLREGGAKSASGFMSAQELGPASLCLAVNLIASNPYRSDRLLSGLGS